MHARRSTTSKSATPVLLLIALLIVVTLASWLFLAHRAKNAIGPNITISYTKMDGHTEVSYPVSLRPRLPGESSAEHLRNAALYAAVSAVAGPPAQTDAIRFPPGTRVLSVNVTGSTAVVDLSNDVEHQPGGSFGETGEFKALVYTLTALPGIDAVQVTIAGRTLATLPGGHLELDQPLRRSDF